jgi:hypothetical protein
MLKNRKDRRLNERLDQVGRGIIRASATNEGVAEEASSSPFLYTRLRSALMEERRRREEGESWLTMLSVAWRTVPAMALVAVFALAVFLFSSSSASNQNGFSDEALLGAPNGSVEQVVFSDRQPLSRDEVLATIWDTDEQGASK